VSGASESGFLVPVSRRWFRGLSWGWSLWILVWWVRDEVVEVGFASLGPMDEMVGVAPGDRCRTAFPDATTIAVFGQVAPRLDGDRHLVDDRLHDPDDPVAGDHPAVLPPMTGLAVDPQPPTCLRVRYPLANQLHIQRTLLSHRPTPRTPIRTRSHSYLHTTGTATIAGIRPSGFVPYVDGGVLRYDYNAARDVTEVELALADDDAVDVSFGFQLGTGVRTGRGRLRANDRSSQWVHFPRGCCRSWRSAAWTSATTS